MVQGRGKAPHQDFLRKVPIVLEARLGADAGLLFVLEEDKEGISQTVREVVQAVEKITEDTKI